jgi:hypothetical protein
MATVKSTVFRNDWLSKGFLQQYGIDYNEIFAPVLWMEVLPLLLTIGCRLMCPKSVQFCPICPKDNRKLSIYYIKMSNICPKLLGHEQYTIHRTYSIYGIVYYILYYMSILQGVLKCPKMS